MSPPPAIAAVDLFCGAGGLSYGLRRAGVRVVAGVDLDPSCEFPFTANNPGARFVRADIAALDVTDVLAWYPRDTVRVLAGCAPCQPFSPFLRGSDTTLDAKWGLLAEFQRLATELRPELITMENVPGLASQAIFDRFVAALEEGGYIVRWRSLECPRFGLPQNRRRLVLIASRIGAVNVPRGAVSRTRTVRDAIGNLPPLAAGQRSKRDRLHVARALSDTNLARIRASAPGGSWEDWPESLRAGCHQKTTGASFRCVYGRMEWDAPSPTITTQAHNFGTGRFGHPEQDRAISLREAAILQGFPRSYRFVPPRASVKLQRVGRLIGNAVPPPLGEAIGRELLRISHAPGGHERAAKKRSTTR